MDLCEARWVQLKSIDRLYGCRAIRSRSKLGRKRPRKHHDRILPSKNGFVTTNVCQHARHARPGWHNIVNSQLKLIASDFGCDLRGQFSHGQKRDPQVVSLVAMGVRSRVCG